MSAPRVPLELQKVIIDSVQDHDYSVVTATLRSCALTCSAWLPWSRRRLHSRLQLVNPVRPRLNRLVALLDRDTEARMGVGDLEITDRGSDSASKYPCIDTEVVLLMLSQKLPRLTSLYMDFGPIRSLPMHPPPLAGFPALNTLRLESVTFTSIRAFRRMLCAAPALRKLFVGNATWISTYTIPIGVQSIQLRYPALTHLAWNGQSSAAESYQVSALQIIMFT